MPIKIALRINRDHSPFREMLKKLILSPMGDTLILCSGYIWQPDDGSYNILEDELLDTIGNGCGSGLLITIAGKFQDDRWRQFYRNFIRKIREEGISIQAYEAPKRNWHAKVAFRMDGNDPVACLVGSSNLTGPAYAIDRYSWNFESDVLIWRQDSILDQHFRSADSLLPGFGNLDLILNPQIDQPEEKEQIIALYKDVTQHDLLEKFPID